MRTSSTSNDTSINELELFKRIHLSTNPSPKMQIERLDVFYYKIVNT